MSIALYIKKALRHLGFDIVTYRPFYETVAQPLGISTILDIGANNGVYASEMRSLFPEATIHAFEPLSDCFATLQQTHEADSKVLCHNIALGDTGGSATIERSSFHPSSSLLHMSSLHKALYPKSAGSSKEEIHIERLDDIAPTLTLTGSMLVKMDVQGFEDKVIAGGKETIGKAALVVCETSFVPLYEGQPLFNEIYQSLHALGFVYYGSTTRHYSRRTDTLMYEDAVFIKPDLIRV